MVVIKYDGSEYSEYAKNVEVIKSYLGIDTIDWYTGRTELAPYLLYITGYLAKELIELGKDADITEKINRIFEISEHGADLIVGDDCRVLAEEIGMTEIMEEILPGYIEFNADRWNFCWSDALSSLSMRLKWNYSSLLVEPIEQGCPCSCGTGETTKDWEAYSSGVWPEDENYKGFGYSPITNGGLSKIPSCNCGYRLTN